MRSTKGFSLLELMIVIVIILLITTIAIPNYLTSRKLANETAAITELKTLHTAQISYTSMARSFGTIPDLIAAHVLDPRFSGTLSGYNFTVTLTEGGDYVAEAKPASSINGRYAYTASADGIVRFTTISTLAPPGMAGNPIP
jgi:type IV pilus assembly protein PilA